MPLIDAYFYCDEIYGGYKAPASSEDASKRAYLESSHYGWSEISSFDYSLDSKKSPKISISKSIDRASNAFYSLYLKRRTSKPGGDNKTPPPEIGEIVLEFCRWIDDEDSGKGNKFQVFLQYTFEGCRILEYSTEANASEDDLPEEKISFNCQKMTMSYFYREATVTSEGKITYSDEKTSEFTHDFRNSKSQ